MLDINTDKPTDCAMGADGYPQAFSAFYIPEKRQLGFTIYDTWSSAEKVDRFASVQSYVVLDNAEIQQLFDQLKELGYE